MKYLILFAFVSTHCFAEQNIDEYLDRLGIDRSEFEGVTYEVEEGTESTVVFYSQDPLPKEKQKVLVFIGAGIGLVHNMGTHLLLLRKNEQGNLTWFVEGSLDFLTTRFGSYPDNVSVGAGILPFRRPTFGVAMKLYNPSYSEKTGFGPELQFNKFVGKNSRLRFYTKVSTAIYLGEPNAEGRSYTIMPEVQLGASLKLFQFKL